MIDLKKTGCLLFFIISISVAHAQRLNTGINMDIYGIHLTRFPSDVVFSETTYKGYYVKKIQAPRGFQQNYGINILIDYSRFFVNARFNLTAPLKGVIYKLSYPIGGNAYMDYYSKIYYQQTEFSASFGYFIKTQSFRRPYLEAGFGRAFPYFYTEDFSDDKSFDTYWAGQHEIREYMGLYKPHNFLILGYGYRGDNVSAYLRYNIRLGNQNVYYSTLSLGFAFYTKFSKLRKHYIYQPEE
jgi:hypothetical protein